MSSSAVAPRNTLPGTKLKGLIETIVELPATGSGAAGLTCVDRESYAGARSLLILVAIQVYPFVKKRFPTLKISCLKESDPLQAVSTSSKSQVYIRCVAGDPNRIEVNMPVRSPAHLTLLSPSEVLRNFMRALILWSAAKHGDELEALVSALEKDFQEATAGGIPTTVADLNRMGVLPMDYVKQHMLFTGLLLAGEVGGSGSGSSNSSSSSALASPPSAPSPAESSQNASSSGSSSTAYVSATAFSGAAFSPPQASTSSKLGSELSIFKGSAVNLWWPVPDGVALTYAAMKDVSAAKKEEVLIQKAIAAADLKEKMVEAAKKRMSGGGV